MAMTVETFTTTPTGGTWTPPAGCWNVRVLVIGGAGGGGGAYGIFLGTRRAGGGGGAGGYQYNANFAVTPGTPVTVTIGAGGSGGVYNVNNAVGGQGANSVFGSITASGGGAGGGSPQTPSDATLQGRDGGCGGGEAVGIAADGASGGSGSQGQGGGTSWYESTVTNRASGGGGGSSGAGGDASSGAKGTGGAGTSNSISGSPTTYCTGGDGGLVGSALTGADGAANTGNGGGGAVSSTILSYVGGAGGSGIVIIAYNVKQLTETATLTASLLKLPKALKAQVMTLATTFTKTKAIVKTEAMTLTGSLVKLGKLVKTQAVTLTDTIAKKQTLKRTLTDAATLAANALKLPKAIKTQTMTLAGSLVKLPKKVISNSITLAGTIKNFAKRVFSDVTTLIDTVEPKRMGLTLELLEQMLLNAPDVDLHYLFRHYFLYDILHLGNKQTIYSTDSDSHILCCGDTWSNVRDAADGSMSTNNYDYIIARANQTEGGMQNLIAHAFIFFDTSVIPSDATIIGAKLFLFSSMDNEYLENTFTANPQFDIVVQNGMPTYPHEPTVAGDYAVANYSGNGGTISNWTNGRWNAITLNATGIGWINKSGTTKFALLAKYVIDDVEPPGLDNFAVEYDNSRGNRKPYLMVEYTDAMTKIPKLVKTQIITLASTINKIISKLFKEGSSELIDIGPGAIDRSGWYSSAAMNTFIDTNNPANSNGLLNSVEVWYNNATCNDVKMGTFYGSGTSYTNRDSASLGNVVNGSKQTFTGLSIDVFLGDYLGEQHDVSGGGIETGSSATDLYGTQSGNSMVRGLTKTYSKYASSAISIYGTGAHFGILNWDAFNKIPKVVKTQAITLTGSLLKLVRLVKSQAMTLTDTILKKQTLKRILADAITMAANALKLPKLVKIQAMTLTASLVKIAKLVKSQAITLTEVFSKLRTQKRILTDAFTLAASILKLPKLVKLQTITLAGSIIRLVKAVKSQTITLADTIKRFTSTVKTQIISLSDLVKKYRALIKTETMTLTASLVKIGKLVKTQTITMADTIKRAVGLVKSQSITLSVVYKNFAKLVKSQTVTLSDTVTKLRAAMRVLSEVITNTGSVIRFAKLVKSQAITLGDTAKRVVSAVKTQAITMTSSIVKRVLKSVIEGGQPIDAGPGAIQTANAWSAGDTQISAENPANATGDISVVEVFFQTNATGVKIGAFYGSGTSYTYRASADIGSVAAGSKQTISGVSFSISAGDLLGIWRITGLLYAKTPATFYFLNGDHFVSEGAKTYGTSSWADSIYAMGGGGLYNIDSVSIKQSLKRSLSDAITMTGGLVKKGLKVIAAVISNLDSYIRKTSKVLSSLITLTDVANIGARALTLVEHIVMVEVVNRFTRVVKASVITLSGLVNRFRTMTKTQVITMADSISRNTRLVKTQSITLSGSLQRFARLVRAEAITLSDIVKRAMALVKSEAVTLVGTVRRFTSVVKASVITVFDTVEMPSFMMLFEAITMTANVLKLPRLVRTQSVSLISNVFKMALKKITEVPSVITIGPSSIDRSGSYSGSTVIDRANSCAKAGIIDSMSMFCSVGVTAPKVGTFYGSSLSWTRRDYATLGNTVDGINTFTGLYIIARKDDLLGAYNSDGGIDRDTTGGSGVLRAASDQFNTGTKTYTLDANSAVSIYGSGLSSYNVDTVLKYPKSVRADIITLTGSIMIPLFRILSEVITLAANVVKLPKLVKLQTITLVDSIKKAISIVRIDNITLTGLVKKAVSMVRAQNMTLADALNRFVKLVKVQGFTLLDAVKRMSSIVERQGIVLSDSVNRFGKIVKSQTMSLSDIVKKYWMIRRVELISLADTINKYRALIKSEMIVMSDSVKRFAKLVKSQIVTLSASIGMLYPRVLADTITLQSVVIRKTFKKMLDVISSAEVFTIQKAGKYLLTFFDAISITESTIKLTNRVLASAVSNIDAVRKFIARTFTETKPIAAGNDAIDRGGGFAGSTFIVLQNPANLDGKIDTALIYGHTALTGVKFGTFYNTSGDNFTMRSYASLGNLPIGYNSISGLNITASAGDYIGVWANTGWFSNATSGGSLRRCISTDCFDGVSHLYSVSNNAMSVGGTGVAAYTLIDSISIKSIWSRVYSEAIQMVGNIKKAISGVKAEFMNVNALAIKGIKAVKDDAVFIVEIFSKWSAYFLSKAESLFNTDTIRKASSKVYMDSSAISESIKKSTSRVISSVITLIDTISRFRGIIFSEIISNIDSLKKMAYKVLGDIITLLDTFEKETYIIFREFIDIISLSGSLTKKLSRGLVDSISIVQRINYYFINTGKKTLEFIRHYHTLSFDMKETALKFIAYIRKLGE